MKRQCETFQIAPFWLSSPSGRSWVADYRYDFMANSLLSALLQGNAHPYRVSVQKEHKRGFICWFNIYPATGHLQNFSIFCWPVKETIALSTSHIIMCDYLVATWDGKYSSASLGLPMVMGKQPAYDCSPRQRNTLRIRRSWSEIAKLYEQYHSCKHGSQGELVTDARWQNERGPMDHQRVEWF